MIHFQGRKNFAGEIIREMEKRGFDQGEAEICLKLLEGMMKENIEQPTKRRAFRVSGDHANCKCGHKVVETDNFCGNCGTKLQEQCHFCWVKKEGNYDCGESHCPGPFLLLKSKTAAECKEPVQKMRLIMGDLHRELRGGAEPEGKEFEDVIHEAGRVLVDQLAIMENGSVSEVEKAFRVMHAVSEMLQVIL